MRRSIHGLIAGALCLLGSTAHAQIAIDPVQQCVWQCLAGRGASDPAYHACVRANCSGPAVAPGWVAARTDPRDPPYIDGFSVRAETPDTGLSVSYTCSREGDSWLTLWSRALANRYGLQGQASVKLSMILFIDSTKRYRLDGENYEGALEAAIHLQSPLFADLATAREATLWAQDRSFLGTLPIDGIDALGKAAAACSAR